MTKEERCWPSNLKTRIHFLEYTEKKKIAITLKLFSDIHLHTMHAYTHKHTDVHENTQVHMQKHAINE